MEIVPKEVSFAAAKTRGVQSESLSHRDDRGDHRRTVVDRDDQPTRCGHLGPPHVSSAHGCPDDGRDDDGEGMYFFQGFAPYPYPGKNGGFRGFWTFRILR